MSKTVGALWVREYEKDGKKRKMMAGELDLGALGTIKIAVFKNDKKEKDNQPDYRIVLSEPSTGDNSNTSIPSEDEEDF